MIKPIYTITCINENNNVDELAATSRMFLQTKLTPTEINQTVIDETASSFIDRLNKDKLLYVINTEILNILWNTEKQTIWYARIAKTNTTQILLHAIVIDPKRRNQWAWTFFINHIQSHHHTHTLYTPIHAQHEYNQHCNDYDECYNRKHPSLNRAKLIKFLENNWFKLQNTHTALYAVLFPTTTPPTDADTWSSYDQ